MNALRLLTAALVSLSFACGSAVAADAALKKVDGILVDAASRTVYTFDKDAANSGKSACSGPCAALWPPVAVGLTQPAVPYSVISRDDGNKQLAYQGKPLYLYASDQKPGDRLRDGFKDIWHVVKE